MRRCEKNEEKEGEGGRKKKGRGKGGRKKGGGGISFFTGALYNFYVHSTILKISTPAAGRHFGFFLASLEKNRVGGSVFSFPAHNPPGSRMGNREIANQIGAR